MRVSPIARLRLWTLLCLTTFAVLTGTAAPALAQPVPAVTEYYHLDALGSTRVVTSQTGAVLRHYEFGPFGGQDSQCTQSPDKRLFTGQVRDKETCLDYFGARHMRSTFGRFLTIDPVLDTQAALVDPQQWNRYAYARNNPMKFVDPDGKNPILVAAVVGAIFEWGSTLYDAYSTYTTLQDPTATASDKLLSGGGLLLGAITPGPGGPIAKIVGQQADRVYHSFTAFKRAFGAAGRGMEWHHLVEQTPSNLGRFGAEAVHGTANLIRLPEKLHRQISGYYSSIQDFTGGRTVRDWLRTQSLDGQREFGLQVLRRYGVTLPE